jgi:hypothetical protein
MSGAIPLLPNTPSWRCVQLGEARGHLYLYLISYIANEGGMTMNKEFRGVWRKALETYFMELPQYLPGGSEGHISQRSGLRIRSSRAKHPAATVTFCSEYINRSANIKHRVI